VGDDRFGVRSDCELRQTVSKVSNAGKDQFLSRSLSVSLSFYLVSCPIEVILQARGKYSTYIGLGHVLGLLNPLDGPAKFFDGIDEGSHVPSDIVK